MLVAYVVVALATVAANAGIAIADYIPARFVLANSASVGVPRSWLPALATLKAAGAIGLVVGLLGVRPLGIAAAGGLVCFFAGAIITHVRAGVYGNLAFPGGYLALAVTCLVLGILR
jgi:DoxX-like family